MAAPRSKNILRAASVCAVALAGFSSASLAQAINDPIPERIQKGDIGIELQEVAAGLASPLLLVPAPDGARLFVVDQPGQIRIIENNRLLPEPYLDVKERLARLNKDFDERGLLGLAFDPQFTDGNSPGSRRLFTYSSEARIDRTDFANPHAKGAPNHQSVVASWRVDPNNPLRVDLTSRKELLRIDQPQFNHNGGMIAFGPDGFLYIALGDGGGANDLGPGHNPEIGNAQDKNVVLGKILRIDVNGSDAANGAYGIPRDNPFASGGGVREIYALGLRNPYRFSFDREALLAGDVGQNKLEMLYRVERGGNYGWRVKEGSFKFNINGTIEKFDSAASGNYIDPVLQYDHDEGISIIGGYVYRGSLIPALAGKYVFGDYRHATKINTGRLFYSDLASGQIHEFRIGKNERELDFLLKGFGLDGNGEIYVLGSKEPGPVGTGGFVMKMLSPPVP